MCWGRPESPERPVAGALAADDRPGTQKGRLPRWQTPHSSIIQTGWSRAQAFFGGSASLKTFAQVEPTCFQMGPVVYGKP